MSGAPVSSDLISRDKLVEAVAVAVSFVGLEAIAFGQTGLSAFKSMDGYINGLIVFVSDILAKMTYEWLVKSSWIPQGNDPMLEEAVRASTTGVAYALVQKFVLKRDFRSFLTMFLHAGGSVLVADKALKPVIHGFI